MIRTIWVLVGGGLLTAVYATWVVVGSWVRPAGVPCRCEELPRRWARIILRMAGVRVRIEGADRVDWSAPAVVVANHQSWFDVFALVARLPGKGRFVAKEELGRIPIFGPAWKACGHISVDRTDRKSAVASLDQAGQRVRDESLAVILFPEGTRSRDGRLQEFKKGAFVLAIKTGVPVVPVGIAGSRKVMPKGSFRIRPGEIRIQVGEPIPVAGLEFDDRDRLVRTGRAAVASLMDAAERGDEEPRHTIRQEGDGA